MWFINKNRHLQQSTIARSFVMSLSCLENIAPQVFNRSTVTCVLVALRFVCDHEYLFCRHAYFEANVQQPPEHARPIILRLLREQRAEVGLIEKRSVLVQHS